MVKQAADCGRSCFQEACCDYQVTSLMSKVDEGKTSRWMILVKRMQLEGAGFCDVWEALFALAWSCIALVMTNVLKWVHYGL